MTKRVLHSVLGLVFVLLGTAAGTRALAQDVLTLDPNKVLTQYLIDAWTDELPQGSVNAIAQTPDGYLWLGTQEGLARFDGLRFEVFDKRRGALLNNSVRALLVDRDGSLWIGTRGGGLTRYHDGTFTTYTSKNGLPTDLISSLFQDQDGNLWVGTFYSGLARLAPEDVDGFRADQFTALTAKQGLPNEEIYTLHQTRDGVLWVGTRESGLIRYEDGAFTTLTAEDGLPGDDITTIHQTRDGALWIGTRNGLGRYHRGLFATYTTDDGLSTNEILSFFEDASGVLWIGTSGGGLCRLLGEQITCIGQDSGLTHYSILSLYGDVEGSLWVGTNGGGLNRLRDGKFTSYTTQEGLASDYVFSVYQAYDGAVWVGTEGGGVSRIHNGRITTLTTDDGLPHNEVMSLYGTRDSSLWIGSKGGLARYYKGRLTTYTTDDGLPRNGIWALFADSKDNLWVATVGGLVRHRAGVFTTYTTDDGLASDEITAIAEDPSGDLWVGTYTAGLHRFRDGAVIDHIQTEPERSFVLCVYVDDDGTVWFSTQEGGLHRFRDGEVTTFSLKDGLYSDTISQILEDTYGTLWLSSSIGLFAVSKQDLEQYGQGLLDELRPTFYGKADGLKSQEFMGGTQPAGWRSTDGRLWFPTVGAGIASIAPDKHRKNDHPPKVIIESAKTNYGEIPLGEEAVVQPGSNRFSFQYVGLSLLAPKQVTYKYMLDGVDEEWIVADTRQEAFYTNLKPGSYTFKVRARNNDGVWSPEAATVSFYLKPYFYQTKWFYWLSVVGLALMAFLVYRLRIGHLKRRERELVALVEARTTDLRQEKERTEEALRETERARREAERQKNIVEEAKTVIEEQAEKLQEMDRIKTRFFNNISHEFRTPLTLNIGPLENALIGVYGPLSADLKRQVEVMLRNSRLLLRLINQLLDVAKLESGKMDLRVRHGNLIELLEGVVFSFTAFAEKKELNLSFTSEHKDLSLNFDSGHLEKVFFNLLSNAIKFTPENGTINVTLSDGEVGANGVAGETIIIRFQDTGPGIPEEALPYIFDRFQQVDGTISRMQEGTGIGLSLVKELIELHGGTIYAESEVGIGTSFIVTLPRDTSHLEAAGRSDDFEGFESLLGKASDSTSRIADGPMVEMAVLDDIDEIPEAVDTPAVPDNAPTVLVVDDNPEIRTYVAGCLKQAYHVIKAINGREALEKVRTMRPDLVISDVMMPVMNGYELCHAVKTDPRLSHVPVILLTSRASLEEKIKGLEAGSDDYLTKPFSARELQVRVRNLLRLSKQKKELKALNEALYEANEDLREASQMKSQLLRIAAHDLKNPLNGIREFAKILKEEVGADASSYELLDLIHTSSDQMLTMVSKLLDSEALESGELDVRKEPVSMSKIAAEVVRRNRPQAERKQEKLIFHLDEDDPYIVEGSSEWLREAMDNLISNAIKYSPLGKNIWVVIERAGPFIRFIVRDEGPGLTEQDKKKLFGKFQRLSAVPTSNESSTGLGLSIVKQIVELHGGRVWAESIEGEGSTFIIELDAVPSPDFGEPSGPLSRDRRDRIPPFFSRRATPSSDNPFPAERE